MRRTPPHHLARSRLTEHLREERVGVVEAGGGAGKSSVALDLAIALGTPVVSVPLSSAHRSAGQVIDALLLGARSAGVAGPTHLAELRALPDDRLVDALLEVIAERDDPVLVIIDDVHHAGAEAAGLVLRLAQGMPPPHRALVLTRRLPSALAAPVTDLALTRLGATDLAFTDDEVHALMVHVGMNATRADAAALRRATDGWAAAVAISARRIVISDDPAAELRRLTAAPITVQALINNALAELSPSDRDAAIQVAHLPTISARTVSSLGLSESMVERWLDVGLPILPAADGSIRLIDPARDVMREAAPLRPEVAVCAADVLTQEGDPLAGFRLLAATGQAGRGLAVLESLPDQTLRSFDFSELSSIVDPLPDELAETAPRLLLVYALACEQSGRKLRKQQVLARVESVARGTGTALERDLDAEIAATLMREDRPDEAAALANAVLGRSGPIALGTRIRLLEVLARAAAGSCLPDALVAAEGNFREAMRLSLQAGRPEWAARSAVPLAGRVYWAQGRHHTAVRCLDEALEALPSRGRQRGFMLTFRAEVLVDCGEYDEARGNLAEAHELGSALHDDRTVAYTAWVEARQASQLGQPAQLLDRLAAVDRSPGEWYGQHSSGVTFCADAAALLDRVGDSVGARAYLHRAQLRRDENERLVAIAEAVLEARSGDALLSCRLLDRLLAAEPGAPIERWWLLLFRAYAGHRAGAADAGWLAADAFDAAGRMEAPTLPLVRDRVVAEELLLTAVDHGSVVAATLAPISLPTRITLLGRFSVHRGGRDITPPPGRAAQLVKLLALSGGRAALDMVTEALWPDDEEGAGRTRVRNVLSRLQHLSPDLVTRDGEALAFAGSVSIDLDRFLAEASRAVALAQRGDAAAAAAARGVLSRYRGPVLPDDLREEWAGPVRRTAVRRVLSILDLLVSAAQQAGDAHEAADLAERAVLVDPAAEDLYLRAARLQLACGQPARARELVGRARRVTAELGVRPGAALLALEAELAA